MGEHRSMDNDVVRSRDENDKRRERDRSPEREPVREVEEESGERELDEDQDARESGDAGEAEDIQEDDRAVPEQHLGKGAEAGSKGPTATVWSYTMWIDKLPRYIAIADIRDAILRLPSIRRGTRFYYTAIAEHKCPTTGRPHLHVMVHSDTKFKRGGLVKFLVAALRDGSRRLAKENDLDEDIKRWIEKKCNGQVVRNYDAMIEYIVPPESKIEQWKKEHGYQWHREAGTATHGFAKVDIETPGEKRLQELLEHTRQLTKEIQKLM